MSPEQNFWSWFVQSQSEFLDVNSLDEEKREQLFERLGTELEKVDPELTFEFGSGPGRRDFVVSANGIREAFGSVIRLCKVAPDLRDWNVVAFRPRRGEYGTIHMEGTEIRGDDLTFTLLDNGSKAGLLLFLPGYTDEKPELKNIGYLFLDEALGEYDVEMGLGPIRFHPPEAAIKGDRHPFRELPAMFDQLTTRLRGTSGKSN